MKKTTIAIIVLLIVVAGLVGLQLGHRQNGSQVDLGNKSTSTSPNKVPEAAAPPSADVASLVSHTLPDGWKEAACPGGNSGKILVVPNGATLNCDGSPSAPVSISVDRQATTDCQQLNGVQGVRKHTCKSLYIGGHKSLQALTEYPKSASYSQDTTMADYYIDTGKGVVKVDYTYSGSAAYQTGFDQLARSVTVK